MLKYVVKRLLGALPLLLLITVLCFGLMELAPYDAVDVMTTPGMPVEQVQAIKIKYGFDKPAPVRYVKWLNGILHGDFGVSIRTRQSISSELAARIPNTVKLVLPAYLFSFLLAIFLGMRAGHKKGGRLDRWVNGLCGVGMALPSFWVAMLLLLLFSYTLGLFPVMGMYTPGVARTAKDFLLHFSLPFANLSLAFLPGQVRYIRAMTIGQMKEGYIEAQKALGASESEILRRHVSRNVMLPAVTQLGMALPMLVTGAVVTETIFGWPGVGPYFVAAVKAFDYPVVMAVLLLSATLVILGNLIADLLYGLIDPRIQKGGAK